MNKKQLSERDICTKYITPALEKAGWDVTTQIREEFPITKGRIIVRGKLHTRAKHKRADYVLFYKPNIPIAIIEAKDNNHTVGDGMCNRRWAMPICCKCLLYSAPTATVFCSTTRLPPANQGAVLSSGSLPSTTSPLRKRFGNGGRSTVA